MKNVFNTHCVACLATSPYPLPQRIVQRVQASASSLKNFSIFLFFLGSRGGAEGGDTLLQAGRLRVRFSMVSLEFFIDTILPAALWPWG